MDYGEILSKAWQIIWKHKILWLFGLFAGCAAQGGSNGGQINYRVNNGNEVPPQMQHLFDNIASWQVALLVGVILLIVLILFVLAITLGTIGKAGLIEGTLTGMERDQSLTFREVWNTSMPYFWRLLGLNLIVGLGITAVLFLLGILAVVFTVGTFGIGLLCLLPLLCVFIPLWWALGIYIQQANLALVVEDLSIPQAFQRGWQVLSENPAEIIIMGLILGLGGGIINLLIAAPMGFALAPFVGSLILGGERALRSGVLMAGLCLVGYLPILLLLGSVLQAYLQSAWTLTYVALTGSPDTAVTSTDEPPENALPSAS